jgi:hypothetical protein
MEDSIIYCPDTGSLLWARHHRRTDLVGKEAGNAVGNGYRQVKLNGKVWLAHRLAYFIQTGTLPAMIDHINGDRSDNRFANLRPIDAVGNGQNRYGLNANNKSGVRGVCFSNGRWLATIQVDGKSHRLGKFYLKESAIAARRKAEQELHKFSPLNQGAANGR